MLRICFYKYVGDKTEKKKKVTWVITVWSCAMTTFLMRLSIRPKSTYIICIFYIIYLIYIVYLTAFIHRELEILSRKYLCVQDLPPYFHSLKRHIRFQQERKKHYFKYYLEVTPVPDKGKNKIKIKVFDKEYILASFLSNNKQKIDFS